ncbi:MAG TPA: sodium/proton-translocating pyrophosphatase, partial [Pirellulales bacterium]|nr:sodium/proton-translocating pyrophosphatase [Pirellulales bacterium]
MKKLPTPILALICGGFLFAAGWADIAKTDSASDSDPAKPAVKKSESFELFTPFKPKSAGGKYEWYEQVALGSNVVVALAGLAYALMLVGYVRRADQGTARMQEIARAVREGADAYLFRQFRVVGVLIVIITGVLWWTADKSGSPPQISVGRAVAFLVGSLFSATVGFIGMRLATVGNLRVAAAARTSFGQALQLGYRTGTITGMLTDGLGLLGGSIIFLIYGEQAYEALLGFGFGGTLLALFMRVGGGIYTKAADVGADLVGKVEKDIPEDDPRNAATIADNVGDNVGDCAGMAADIFESYEVTIVAAMILGIASFGHKGVIFPLLVRAIGVVASIISTYSVKAGDKGTAAEAMKSVNRGFVIGSLISVAGFIVLGWFYLRYDQNYLTTNPTAATAFANPGAAENVTKNLPTWVTLGQPGLDMRPAWACLIGIILAVALNKCTEYYTGTEYSPVKSLTKSCETGHATNIIQGFAVGYESSVAAVLIIAAAIMASALVFVGTSPTFVAFGVAMAGIGMLTLTGNTISMDVFGPVADNANGIGEMGYDKKEMGEAKYKEARQTLADLDAVGNTTKAITKGIAIGSAVIAAVSLFASFIAVLVTGSEEKIGQLLIGDF